MQARTKVIKNPMNMLERSEGEKKEKEKRKMSSPKTKNISHSDERYPSICPDELVKNNKEIFKIRKYN